MAAQSLEKKSKSPKGAQIVHLPCLGETQFVLCAGTHLPLGPTAIMADNAKNAFAFASPFIAALTIRNVQDRRQFSSDSLAYSPVDKLFPGLHPRQMSMMFNNLTTKNPEANFDMDRLAEAAAKCGSTKKKNITVFVEALENALATAPFRWHNTKDDIHHLPLGETLEKSITWGEIAPGLSLLLELAAAFEKEWGWHCDGLYRSVSSIAKKRRDRRTKKSKDESEDSGEDAVMEAVSDDWCGTR